MYLLRTLGGLALERDGVRVDAVAAQRKALALLAVLASSRDRGVGRDKLSVLFWPESDTDRARGALKQTLHILRRHLGSTEAIAGTAELRLNPEHVQSDVGRFREALEAGELEAAVQQYRGPFLDGVYVEGAPEFERWVDEQRAELARRHCDALEQLARAAEARGEHDQAVSWWRRLQAADPLNSRVALGLMAALDAAGDRAAALQHARIHELLLQEELGMEPDPAVSALVEQLRSPRAPAPQPSPPEPPAAPEWTPAAPPTAGEGAAIGVSHLGADRPEPGSSTPRRSRWVPAAALLALAGLLAAAAALAGRADLAGRATAGPTRAREAGPSAAVPVPQQGSIAVLPFVDMSPTRDQEYLSDGMTEELISHLARVDGLRVAARTSAFQFKGMSPDVREVGEKLRVATVLEGSVRKVGDRLKITAQLVDAENGYNLWTETYERPASDVLSVQEEISRAIVSALQIHLAEPAVPARRTTENVLAYELYLRGRYFWNKRTEESLVQATEYFRQAIAIDPGFAQAHAGLADVEIAPRLGAPAERFRRAKAAAARALELDSTLAEAHTSMGWIKTWYDRDRDGAEWHFQRAIQLNPNYSTTYAWYSGYLAAIGRLDEGVKVMHRAHDLDPLSIWITTHVGSHYLLLRQPATALEYYRKALELDPSFFMAHWGIGRAYLQLGRYQDALKQFQPRGTDYLGLYQAGLIGYTHARAGHEAEARRILSELSERRQRGEYVAPTEFAVIHLGLGERGRALAWLERVEADRGARIFLRTDHLFDSLRSDPGFHQILRKLGPS